MFSSEFILIKLYLNHFLWTHKHILWIKKIYPVLIIRFRILKLKEALPVLENLYYQTLLVIT